MTESGDILHMLYFHSGILRNGVNVQQQESALVLMHGKLLRVQSLGLNHALLATALALSANIQSKRACTTKYSFSCR